MSNEPVRHDINYSSGDIQDAPDGGKSAAGGGAGDDTQKPGTRGDCRNAQTVLQQAEAIVVTKETRHWLRANVLRPLALAACTALIVFLLLSFGLLSWFSPG